MSYSQAPPGSTIRPERLPQSGQRTPMSNDYSPHGNYSYSPQNGEVGYMQQMPPGDYNYMQQVPPGYMQQGPPSEYDYPQQ
jgi:hypothetical protein